MLIAAGGLLLLDAGLTLAWQEPVSALYGHLAQRALDDDLRDARRVELDPLERRVLGRLRREPQRLAFLARSAERRAKEGAAVGRIVAPEADIDFAMVHGVDPVSLRKGPGHYPTTAMPGEPGTVAVAGHRTTYQAPFRHLDAFRPGDEIRLEMPYGDFEYRVERTRIVAPDAWWITRNVGYQRLVLSACHPLYSAAKRIVVFARLVRAQAAGRAAASR